jgi:predicted nucleotidyltransferase
MTADLTQEQMARYKRTAWLREKTRRRVADDRRQAAVPIAERAAAILKEQFGAQRVILFGSLAHGHWFGPKSDIDLAAEGIQVSDFWRAWCALDEIDSDFEINLIAIESASASLQEALAHEGVEL